MDTQTKPKNPPLQTAEKLAVLYAALRAAENDGSEEMQGLNHNLQREIDQILCKMDISLAETDALMIHSCRRLATRPGDYCFTVGNEIFK